jgi:hypothetical protein
MYSHAGTLANDGLKDAEGRDGDLQIGRLARSRQLQPRASGTRRSQGCTAQPDPARPSTRSSHGEPPSMEPVLGLGPREKHDRERVEEVTLDRLPDHFPVEMQFGFALIGLQQLGDFARIQQRGLFIAGHREAAGSGD